MISYILIYTLVCYESVTTSQVKFSDAAACEAAKISFEKVLDTGGWCKRGAVCVRESTPKLTGIAK